MKSPTGRKQLVLYPESQMAEMGTAAFTDVQKSTPKSNDARARATAVCVARHLEAVVPKDKQPKSWEVQVFEDPTPNAFALPGGKIGVNTGMFSVAKTPSQLAAVIGHEIGHVLARHSNERLSTSTVAEAGLVGTSLFLGTNTPEKRAALGALGVGTQVGVLLPFSRTQESEADTIGLDLMAKAGFDPREAVTLWENMKKAGGGAPPEFLSTHPSDQRRIDALRAKLPSVLPTYEKVVAEGKRADCPEA